MIQGTKDSLTLPYADHEVYAGFMKETSTLLMSCGASHLASINKVMRC